MPHKQKSKRGLVIFLIGILIFSLVGNIHFFRVLSRAISSNSWLETKGKITSSKVISKWQGGKQGRTRYLPEIIYQYSVKNDFFSGEKISAFPATFREVGPAQEIVNQFQMGTTVTVFYNPVNPHESLLIRGITKGLIRSILLTGALLLGALFWLILILRRNSGSA